MSIQSNSNLPTSRISNCRQVYNTENTNELLYLHGQIVNGINTLVAQISQNSNFPLNTNLNLTQFKGLTRFNTANAFVPEKYDKVTIDDEDTTVSTAIRYFDNDVFKTKVVITYSDFSKQEVVLVERIDYDEDNEETFIYIALNETVVVAENEIKTFENLAIEGVIVIGWILWEQ